MRLSECASPAAASILIKCPNPELARGPGRGALITRVSLARMTRSRFEQTGGRAAGWRGLAEAWGRESAFWRAERRLLRE